MRVVNSIIVCSCFITVAINFAVKIIVIIKLLMKRFVMFIFIVGIIVKAEKNFIVSFLIKISLKNHMLR